MLVEFRVRNFRSLRDEQVLSLVAAKDKSLAGTNTITTDVKAVPELLRSAVLYGANASGKSNLIRALQYMQGVVRESARIGPEETFNVQPFRLDSAFEGEPTSFEVTFLIDSVRYQYGFSLVPERVVEEHLLVYKASKPQRWFERSYDESTGEDSYYFGSGLKGPKSTWEESTRPNSLFLSMAAQLNSESLRPVFNWLVNTLVIFNEHNSLGPNFTISQLHDREKRQAICDFLGAADISIDNIEVESRKVAGQAVHVNVDSGKAEVLPEERNEARLFFHHVTENGKAVFEFADESAGTRNLLALAGPVLDILHRGRVLVVDELDTSLHPLVVRELVRMFHCPKANCGQAQLIFTTHDTSLLDAPQLLRRDQVWLVDKDSSQATELVALWEYSPRKNEALERGYLTGRYGGVPFLRDGLSLRH